MKNTRMIGLNAYVVYAHRSTLILIFVLLEFFIVEKLSIILTRIIRNSNSHERWYCQLHWRKLEQFFFSFRSFFLFLIRVFTWVYICFEMIIWKISGCFGEEKKVPCITNICCCKKKKSLKHSLAFKRMEKLLNKRNVDDDNAWSVVF